MKGLILQWCFCFAKGNMGLFICQYFFVFGLIVIVFSSFIAFSCWTMQGITCLISDCCFSALKLVRIEGCMFSQWLLYAILRINVTLLLVASLRLNLASQQLFCVSGLTAASGNQGLLTHLLNLQQLHKQKRLLRCSPLKLKIPEASCIWHWLSLEAVHFLFKSSTCKQSCRHSCAICFTTVIKAGYKV